LLFASLFATFVSNPVAVGGLSLIAIIVLCLVYADLVKSGITEVKKFLKVLRFLF
jgi:hypothetical protein